MSICSFIDPLFWQLVLCQFAVLSAKCFIILLFCKNVVSSSTCCFCKLAVLSTCYIVNLLFYQIFVIFLLCQRLVLSICCFYKFAVLPICCLVYLFHQPAPYQQAVSTTCCFINLLFHQLAVLLMCCFVNLLFQQLAVLSTYAILWKKLRINFFKSDKLDTKYKRQVKIGWFFTVQ